MWCKKCWSATCYKAWFIRWLQRYKCKECWCTYTNSEKRRTASMGIKIDALKLYTSWLWFRAIGRFLGYSNVAVLNWIKWFWELASTIHQENTKEWKIIEYIEMDELYHYVQKKQNNFEYGRLSVDEKTILLILPSETVARKQGESYEKN